MCSKCTVITVIDKQYHKSKITGSPLFCLFYSLDDYLWQTNSFLCAKKLYLKKENFLNKVKKMNLKPGVLNWPFNKKITIWFVFIMISCFLCTGRRVLPRPSTSFVPNTAPTSTSVPTSSRCYSGRRGWPARLVKMRSSPPPLGVSGSRSKMKVT